MSVTVRGVCAATCGAVLLAAALDAAPVNLSGTWSPKYWTLKIALQQEGDRVWGTGGAKDFWLRGHWDGKRLLLVVNNFQEARKGQCTPRGVFTITGTTVSAVSTTWWRPGERPLKGPWTRISPDAGEPIVYPYATELNYCGVLRTYELAFASGSDRLTGSEWPILEAVAGVLKGNPSTKIQVAGHTDSTGDPSKNQTLSEARAAAVRQVLASKYGADEARISVKGWGAEQPIEENTTEDGRALNRRVEIVLAR